MNSDKKAFIKITMLVILGIVMIIGIVIFILNKKSYAEDDQPHEISQEADEEIYDEDSGVYSTQTIEVYDNEDSLAFDGVIEDYVGYKQIYLTFDDGPSIYTNAILDILAKYDVKATFFVLGKTDDNSVKAYKRIVEEGHTLAMHSNSHKYNEIYKSKESFVNDLKTLQEYLYDVTGVWCRIYRFPGGSSNTVSKVNMSELISYLNEEGIRYFDWNISSGDATGSNSLSAQTITNNCIRNLDKYDVCVILLHDTGDRYTTVDALDDIIESINKRKDSVFLPITDETILVQHKSE